MTKTVLVTGASGSSAPISPRPGRRRPRRAGDDPPAARSTTAPASRVRRRGRPAQPGRGADRRRRRALPRALAGLRRLRGEGRGRRGDFGGAAARAGLERIVYLGGLGDDDGDLSAHLRSRREVEQLLRWRVPVTVLRAAVVIGHGGISWEITRQLVDHLPAMITPKWVNTRTQPIALPDVVRYLVGVLDAPRPRAGCSRSAVRTCCATSTCSSARPRSRASALPNVNVPLLTPAPVVALAGPGHRRRHRDRAQPGRLDDQRGRRARRLDRRRRARAEPSATTRRCGSRSRPGRGRRPAAESPVDESA